MVFDVLFNAVCLVFDLAFGLCVFVDYAGARAFGPCDFLFFRSVTDAAYLGQYRLAVGLGLFVFCRVCLLDVGAWGDVAFGAPLCGV